MLITRHVEVMPLIFDAIQRQKEELHNRIIRLEKQLDAKQALELEIERLRGALNVMKHMEDDGDVEVLRKMDAIIKNLREKEGELNDLEALNQTLIVRERKSNDELQDARKELINVSSFYSSKFTEVHDFSFLTEKTSYFHNHTSRNILFSAVTT
jgi:Asp-tRNA(Asn)/Glu-tRNA(Gln) amidotransferase A subunit family amidase